MIDYQFGKKTDPFIHWEYLNKETNDRLRIVPERGGLITEWRCNGKEVLYFDQDRFNDKTKSVRGGIPILFPICGDLEGDSLVLPQGNFILNQHGFARDLPWEIDLLKDHSGIRLSLNSNYETKFMFPYSFRIYLNVRLKPNSLEISIQIHNNSLDKMPFSFGLHPYFKISDLEKIKITGLSKECIDQSNMHQLPTLDKLKNLSKGVDFLTGSGDVIKINDLLTGNTIAIKNSFPMDLTVIWTDPPRSMICVEPWTSPRRSLQTGDRKIELEPGGVCNLRTSFLSI